MKTIQISEELWDEIARIIANDIIKQATKPINEPGNEGPKELIPSVSRKFLRKPRRAETRLSIDVNDNMLKLFFEGGDPQSWTLPLDKRDTERIREALYKALDFAAMQGASEGQLKAIRKALTEQGYYLVGPRRSRSR